jgi:hypothetical protein
LLQGIPQFHWYHDFYMRANILTAIQWLIPVLKSNLFLSS